MGQLNPRIGGDWRLRSDALRVRPSLRARGRVGGGRAAQRDRRRAAAGMLCLLALAAAVWALAAAVSSPPAPPVSTVAVPPIDPPGIPAPALHDADAEPSPPLREANPEPSSAEAPSSPDRSTAATEPDVEPSALPPGPQTYRRFVDLHVHEWSLLWLWELPWWPPAALLAAVAATRMLRPLPRAGRWSLAADTALLAAVAAVSWPAMVTVPDSSGQPVTFKGVSSETRQLDNGDTEIVVTRERRHRHLPIEIAVHWGLLGLGSTALLGRRIVALRRAPARRPSPSIATPQGGPS